MHRPAGKEPTYRVRVVFVREATINNGPAYSVRYQGFVCHSPLTPNTLLFVWKSHADCFARKFLEELSFCEESLCHHFFSYGTFLYETFANTAYVSCQEFCWKDICVENFLEKDFPC